MKRKTLWVGLLLLPLIVLGLAVWASAQFSGPVNVIPASPTLGHKLVVAANATWARRGGPDVYLCDGTSTTGGDQVEIQAAINSLDLNGDGDWTDAGEGGVVELVGHLYYSDLTGEMAWAGTGTTAIVSSKTVITVTAWTTGGITDVNTGEVLRISQTAGGTNPATEHDDLVYTVNAVDVKAGTITLHSGLAADYAGLGIDFTRILAAVEVPANVTLRGSGPMACSFRAIAGATCSAILVKGWAVTLEAIHVHNVVNPVAYDGRRNGTIVNADGLDCTFRDMVVTYVEGDGMIWHEGHDCRMEGNCAIESCYGRGLAAIGCTELSINDLLSSVNKKDNLLAHRCSRMLINGMYGYVEAGYGILLRLPTQCIVTNCRLTDNAGASGLLYMYEGTYSHLQGNNLYVNANAVPAITVASYSTYNSICGNVCRLIANNSTGIALSSAYLNTVVGNTIYPTATGAVAFNQEYTEYGNNDIYANLGALPSNECRVIRATNTSGAQIVQFDAVCRRTSGANEIEQATIAGATRFLGVSHRAAIANAATGWIQTEGHCESAQVDGTDDVAVGNALSLDDTNGAFQKAVSTEIAVAIAEEVRIADSVGVQDVYILPPGQRYTVP